MTRGETLLTKRNLIIALVLGAMVLPLLFIGPSLNSSENHIVEVEQEKHVEQTLCEPCPPQPELGQFHHKYFQGFNFGKCLKWAVSFPWNKEVNNWNYGGHGDRRLTPFEVTLNENSVFIEIGGNRGDDMDFFLNTYPFLNYYVFEPVKQWATHLENKHKVPKVHVYAIGLGDEAAELNFDANQGFGANQWGKRDAVTIAQVSDFFNSHPVLNSSQIDVFHINCEGCEYPVLEELIKANYAPKWKVLQFGSHNYPHQRDIMARYCRLQDLLLPTHNRVWGVPGAWERWVRKDVPSTPTPYPF